MDRYVTLGADEDGQVYGLEVGTDNDWIRNSLGYSTSCVVIRPVNRETYEYLTEDPQSAKERWQMDVAADQTELGLEDWFREYCGSNDVFDKSFVYGLLEDGENLTVKKWNAKHKDETFRLHVEQSILDSPLCPSLQTAYEIHDWESAGLFPPKKPFVVEFAPKKLLKEYYAHLRKTYKEFEV